MAEKIDNMWRAAPEIPELMTVRDFLANFRMGRTSFYREVQAGRLQIVKFGRATRIPKSEAMAWLARLQSGEGKSCADPL